MNIQKEKNNDIKILFLRFSSLVCITSRWRSFKANINIWIVQYFTCNFHAKKKYLVMKLFSLRATISFLECSRACHSSREFQHNMVKILLCRLRSNKIEKNSSTVFCSTFYWFFNEFFSVFLLRYYTSSQGVLTSTRRKND